VSVVQAKVKRFAEKGYSKQEVETLLGLELKKSLKAVYHTSDYLCEICYGRRAKLTEISSVILSTSDYCEGCELDQHKRTKKLCPEEEPATISICSKCKEIFDAELKKLQHRQNAYKTCNLEYFMRSAKSNTRMELVKLEERMDMYR